MRRLPRFAVAVSAAWFCALPASPSGAAETADLDKVRGEIVATFGRFPSFLGACPEAALPGLWTELKGIPLNEESALSGRVKELIGLAVAAQIPCDYCVYFHTEVAKFAGATDREIREALAMAAITRHWSTVVNASQQPLPEFRREVDAALEFAGEKAKSASPPAGASAPAPVTDAASAYREIEGTLGSVPTFMRRFPESGIAGAWEAYKAVELSPGTQLTSREKELVGLAVAAQVPCDYCVYFHTRAAAMGGATQEEMDEAVAIAALTRQWSTILNGTQIDPGEFREETDGIVAYMREKQRTAAR